MRALMVEMEAQTSERRNRQTKKSPPRTPSNTSRMYCGMMKSVPRPSPET